MAIRLVTSSAADRRLSAARDWLAKRRPAEEVLVVGATAAAAAELVRQTATAAGAAFGWRAMSLGRLAATLAAPGLAADGVTPIGTLAVDAVVARVLHEVAAAGRLGRYTDAARGPGLARAIARTLAELRLRAIDSQVLGDLAPELRVVVEAFAEELHRSNLADRAEVLRRAAEVAQRAPAGVPLLRLPTLLLDLDIEHAREHDLVAAVAGHAPDVYGTVPAGDGNSLHNLQSALAVTAIDLDSADDRQSLTRLQRHLFESTAPPFAELDRRVTVFSEPGESRECVEIARRLLALAAEGVPFDRTAIALRSPEEYRSHLEEALGRADIPAHFATGAIRPHPAGRAFMALLNCAAERLSAQRFAEYLSLSEVPDAERDGTPPASLPSRDRWVAPDEELIPAGVAAQLEPPSAPADAQPVQVDDPAERPVMGGTLRAPRRWEKLIVEAAVIGGLDRWRRRLDGLDQSLAAELAGLEDPENPSAEGIRRARADLAALRAYALPLLEELNGLKELPPQTWGVWLDRLSALATRALRQPNMVLATLMALAPMAEVGPVDLNEVRRVLEERLLELAVPPAAVRYGRVFVAPIAALRGLAFDVVFVPGLAERLLPRKVGEEPILLDVARAQVDAALTTNTDRLVQERLALRLAVGAARERVVLSYPRLDLDHARPRVPSFYLLEALRAARGKLPGFKEVERDAERVTQSRIGWPAPRHAADAIDDAEHDLALLDTVLQADPAASVGTAHYLLGANPHLGRALRFRARRWLKRWTVADGLVDAQADGVAAMGRHQLDARSYSPTALEKYSACPYQFFLYAVHKLAPREVPLAIEEMNPLQRGSLVHETQFELFHHLRDAGLLPIVPDNLGAALDVLDGVINDVARRFHDDLAPAVERVWEDGIASVRADLREWLRRASEDPSGWIPWRFELAFGLSDRRDRDAHSVAEAVALECGIRLRGSIDLVERRSDGALRATDHKTGRARVRREAVVDGGSALQPLFYALALEQLVAGATVDSGRLYYCSAGGGFEERVVHVNPATRRSAVRVAEVLRAALAKPFLPAAPEEDACRWCDYRIVCGPYEEQRSARKPRDELRELIYLRRLP